MQSLGRALEMVCLSDSGLVRDHNEDAVSIDPEFGFAVLCDGLGGYNAGEVASGMTVSLVAQGLRQGLQNLPPQQLDQASGKLNAYRLLEQQIQISNAAVYEAAQTQPQCAGMGTTIVATLFFDNRVLIGHIGDSRCYRLRGDEFASLTRDHSLLQEQIDLGLVSPEDARNVDYKNLVTRALGIEPEAEPDFGEYTVEPGDVYLLCSDGLNDMVEDHEIADIIGALRLDLTVAAQQLVHCACDYGGRDNVSVILIRVKEAFPAVQGWFPWLFSWFGGSRGDG